MPEVILDALDPLEDPEEPEDIEDETNVVYVPVPPPPPPPPPFPVPVPEPAHVVLIPLEPTVVLHAQVLPQQLHVVLGGDPLQRDS